MNDGTNMTWDQWLLWLLVQIIVATTDSWFQLLLQPIIDGEYDCTNDC